MVLYSKLIVFLFYFYLFIFIVFYHFSTLVESLKGHNKKNFYNAFIQTPQLNLRNNYFSSSINTNKKFASTSSLKASDQLEQGTTTNHFRGALEISSLTNKTTTIFDTEKIKEILPHRYPFLLVDKIVEYEEGKRAVGIKQVSINEDFFNGHFPNRPVMPGVLQIEALAQLCGVLALKSSSTQEKSKAPSFLFAGVNGVKWRKVVSPGDTLVMEVELLLSKSRFPLLKAKGKSFVDGQIANEVDEMTFVLVSK